MSDLHEDFVAISQDIERARKRAKDAGYLEYKKDAAENLYPLIQSLLEAVDARLRTTEEVVGTLLEETESIIQPDLAGQIFGLIDLGNQLVEAVKPLTLDDVSKKRVMEIIAAWEVGASLVIEAVEEVAIDDEPDEDDEETEDEEDAEGEEDDTQAANDETEQA